MRVLIVLTYYRPHTSGLTIYAERLARGLARRGYEVTILTSHYKRIWPIRSRWMACRWCARPCSSASARA